MSPARQARQAIEALRAGVPSPAAAKVLGTTQFEIVEIFRSALGSLESGEGAKPIGISGEFGSGKSHLLRLLKEEAADAGFVTSYVVVSPEVPLGKLKVLHEAINEQAEAPAMVGKALMELAVKPGFDTQEALRRLQDWVRDSGVADRFGALMRIMETFSREDDLRARILQDFEGDSMTKGTIGAYLTKLHERAEYALERRSAEDLAKDRILLLAQWAYAHDAKGLVLFLDEVERIGVFSYRSRQSAYRSLGWLYEACQLANSRLMVVYASTQGSVHVTLEEDWDRARNVGNALADENSRLERIGIEALRTSLIGLIPAGSNELETIQHKVRSLYAEAYPDTVQAQVPISGRTPREAIRSWITVWDLARHYPEYTAQVETKDVRSDQTEVEDDLLANGATEADE